MSLKKRLQLSECAICPYAEKRRDKKIRCGWDNKTVLAESVKECGHFPNLVWIDEL